MIRRLEAMWRSLPRNRWTLERFGLSPEALPLRLRNEGAPEVFFVSIPKAGTHLLERALCLHPQIYRKLIPTVTGDNIARWKGLDGLLGRLRPGQVVGSHLRFDPQYPAILEKHGTRALFLIRDPHDIVVSQIHYASRRTDHRHHDLFAALPDVKARLRIAIAGDERYGVASIGERLDSYIGWMDACHVVRFEDLVGPQGGGDRQTQVTTVKGIYDFLTIEVSDQLVVSICDRLFSPDSPTFRCGSIGRWRESFDAELEGLFDAVVGDRMVPYGYHLRGEG
jgi:hypothetical protein